MRPANLTDPEFLVFLRDRMVNVYKESPNADFVRRLERIAQTLQHLGNELSL